MDFSLNNRKVLLGTPLTSGDSVEINVVNHEITMADILNIINFQGTPSPGQNKLVLRINGREAQFTTSIKDGDCLEIGWTI